MNQDPNTLVTTAVAQDPTRRPVPSPVPSPVTPPATKRPILKLPTTMRAAMTVPPEVADPGLIRIGAAVGQWPRHG